MTIEKRNIGLYIVLSIVTCGIFGLVWFVSLTDDSKTVSGDQDSAGGGMALLLTIITCGIYGYYWAYKLGEKVDHASNIRGIGDGSDSSKILFLLMQFLNLGIVNYIIGQDKLNKIAEFDEMNGNRSFGGQQSYNNQYNYQNGNPMGNQYNNPYNNPYNNQYNNQYNYQNGNPMGNQYNNPYNNQVNPYGFNQQPANNQIQNQPQSPANSQVSPEQNDNTENR